MQFKLDQERRDKQAVEERLFAAEKKNNDLSVDLAQLHSQISTLKSDIRNENEKVFILFREDEHFYFVLLRINSKILSNIFLILQNRNLALQVEQEIQKRTLMQGDLKTHNQTISQLKTSEQRLQMENNKIREEKKGIESDLRKVKE